VQTVQASTHIAKGVRAICKAGKPTGEILLTSMKMTMGRMDLQFNVGVQTMVNVEGGGAGLYPSHSHYFTFSKDVCFKLGTDKHTHLSRRQESCD
jgi:hypothetical protein